MALDKSQDSLPQLISSLVAQAAQIHRASQVHIAVGVATWTAQGTFACDFYRQHRGTAGKNRLPSCEYLDDFQSAFRTILIHKRTS